MKKYMIPALMMLFIASAAGAQTVQTQPSRSAAAKKEVTARKTTATTKPATSMATPEKAANDAKATAVSRKHHHKKGKPLHKTEGKQS